MPAWTLDISSGYGISLHIFLRGSGAHRGGSDKGTTLWLFKTLHTSLAAFPRAPHMDFVHGEKVPSLTRFSVPTQLGTHRGKLRCRGIERKELTEPWWTRVGVLEHPSPRKRVSLRLSEQGLCDKHGPAHCFSKQRGGSHPSLLMGSLLILKVGIRP